MTIRVLFLAGSLARGGAERQLVSLARGLAEEGCAVSVAVLYRGGAFERDLEGTGIRLIDLNKRGRWDVVRFLVRFAGVLRQERPHIVHGYLVTPNMLSTLARVIVPRSRVVWGVRASSLDARAYDRFSAITLRGSGLLSRLAHAIIVNSAAGREYHRTLGYPSGRMFVIENGIDVDRFAPTPAARARVRRELGIEDDELLVGVVGRLDPMKDHETFIRAAAALAALEPAARFVCIGGGSDERTAELVRLGDDLGLGERLRWTGERADVVELLGALDLCCSSSRFGEGFPNVLGEALSCGTPCVATDVGASRTIIGRGDRVVAPNDPAALSSAMLGTLMAIRSDPRGERVAARDRIVTMFSRARMIERTLGLLRAIAA